MWNLAAEAKILASQHPANLGPWVHRPLQIVASSPGIEFPLHSIFFQNNSL